MKFSKRLEITERSRRGSNPLVNEVLTNLVMIEKNINAGNPPFITSEELVNVYGYTPARAKVGPVSLTYRNITFKTGFKFSVNRAKEGNDSGFTFSFRKATTQELAEAKEKIQSWKVKAEARKVK